MPVSLVGLVPTNLASLCIETFLYGVFVVLFVLALCLMVNATSSIYGERRTYPKSMLCFSVLLFVLITTHWILSVVRAFQAFFLHLGGQAAAEFFAEQSQSLSTVLRHSTLVVLLVIGDIAMVYRLWSIWNHSKRVVIIPIILLFVLCALAVLGIYQFTLPDTGIPQNSESGELTVADAAVWIIVLSTTSFSINIYSTGMIGYKLSRASRVIRDSESISWFRFIAIILAESLSSYTIWGSLLVILFCLKSTFYLFFADTQPPIIGIAFVILHVRVGLRRLGRINTMKLAEGQLGQVKQIEGV